MINNNEIKLAYAKALLYISCNDIMLLDDKLDNVLQNQKEIINEIKELNNEK